MKFAYLIAAHDQPDQLLALLDRLLSGQGDDFAVVHLDAKSALWAEHRDRITRHPSQRVFLVEDPVEVHWATESQLIATERMLRVALKHGFTHAHHMSGVDWPVGTRAQMVADIENDGAQSAYAAILGPEQAERMQGIWLSSKFWRKLPDPPRVRTIRAWVKANKILVPWLARLGVSRSQPLGPWQKGWSWWSLPEDIAADACQLIASLSKSGRLSGTVCSDEHLIPTLLANKYPARLRGYRRFIEWKANESHPQTLSVTHVPAISESGAWFARKCDLSADDFFLTAFREFDRADLQAAMATASQEQLAHCVAVAEHVQTAPFRN